MQLRFFVGEVGRGSAQSEVGQIHAKRWSNKFDQPGMVSSFVSSKNQETTGKIMGLGPSTMDDGHFGGIHVSEL